MLFLDLKISSVQFSSVTQYVQLFATPWTTARQASLSITNSQSLLKLMSIESVMLHRVVKVLELQLQHQSFQ